MMNGYWTMGMWGGAALIMLICIGVIVLAVWGFRRSRPDQQIILPISPVSAPEVVQLRYSRGEISRDEYLALMNDLKLSKETTK